MGIDNKIQKCKNIKYKISMFIRKIKSFFFYIKRFYYDQIIIKFFDEKKVFEKIYKSNYWGSKESISGPGSDLKNTENIRNELPKIISKYNIVKVLDIPCGDFYWMDFIIKNLKIDYLGGDIVYEMIKNNNNLYGSKNVKFFEFNLINDKLPTADLLICRALFFHLNFKSIKKILDNLKYSNIKYILLTNTPKPKNHINKDAIAGSYRDLDLFKSPFLFPNNYLYKFEDTYNVVTGELDQEMILWERNDLLNNL